MNDVQPNLTLRHKLTSDCNIHQLENYIFHQIYEHPCEDEIFCCSLIITLITEVVLNVLCEYV